MHTSISLPSMIHALALALALAPVQAGAQSAATPAPTASVPVALTPLSPVDVVPDDRAPALAGSRADTRIPSKNEAYNRARAAEGRLGVRLGNDLSYRITGN